MIKVINSIRKNEIGFTLIEVMVVIIMVGILAAIAVPIYSNYVYRARVTEAVTTLGALKTYFLERFNANAAWPTATEMNNEFNNFNELYYFNKPVIFTSNRRVAIKMTNKVEFGKPDGDYYPQLDIDLDNPENNGWTSDATNNILDWAQLPDFDSQGTALTFP